MAKGRLLHKKISVDERVADLSIEATVLYMMCIAHLDREGRIYATPEVVKGSVVPYIKELTFEKIAECFKEMAKLDLIILYGEGRNKYAQFSGFKKNQTIHPHEAESVIPAPILDLFPSMSRKCNDNVEPMSGKCNDNSVLNEWNRKELNEKELVSEEFSEVPSQPNITSISSQETPAPMSSSVEMHGTSPIGGPQAQMDTCVSIWNKTMPIKVNGLTPQRRERLLERLKEPGFFRNFESIVKTIDGSDFLSNRTEPPKKWKTTFDWLIKDSENWHKIMEGNFTDNKKQNKYRL